MQLQPATLKDAAKRTLAATLASLVLLLSLASASETLHQALHKHTEKDDDTCAVCMVANGLFESPVSVPALAILVLLVIGFVPPLFANFTGRSEFILPPGRAPPVH